MDGCPPFFERKWKRPSHITPFPNVWRRFTVTSRTGETHKIRIQDLSTDQCGEVWNMYEKYFYPDEELIKSANELQDEVTMVSQKWSFDQCVKENLSLVAILDDEDPKLSSIIGALTLEVVSKDDPPYPTLPGEARAKVQNLFKLLHRNIDEFNQLNINKCFKDYAIVIKSEFRRLGIGSELFRTMEQMARTFQIPAAVIIFNNNQSQALAAKLGYSILNEVKLSDYLDENGQIILPTSNTKVVQLCYYEFL